MLLQQVEGSLWRDVSTAPRNLFTPALGEALTDQILRLACPQVKEACWPVITDTAVLVDLWLPVGRDAVVALGEDEPDQIMGGFRRIACDPVPQDDSRGARCASR